MTSFERFVSKTEKFNCLEFSDLFRFTVPTKLRSQGLVLSRSLKLTTLNSVSRLLGWVDHQGRLGNVNPESVRG